MGIPTLIGSAHTASNAASIAITSGIDSTYDEYMFVCTDLNPATDDVTFGFQVNVDGESGYNELITSSTFVAHHNEGGGDPALTYLTGSDQAQGTSYQVIAAGGLGNGSDESAAGILHLFSPSNTTYVTHFYSRFQIQTNHEYSFDFFTSGYVNVTGAIDEISFKMSSGNMDGVIQMYGIE